MKNHWLENKQARKLPVGYFYAPYITVYNKPIVFDDFVDLSEVRTYHHRYREYDRSRYEGYVESFISV